MVLRTLKGQVAGAEVRDFVKGFLCSGIWGCWDFYPYKGGEVRVSVPPFGLGQGLPNGPEDDGNVCLQSVRNIVA